MRRNEKKEQVPSLRTVPTAEPPKQNLVAKLVWVRILICVATSEGMVDHQMNVNTAFPYGVVDVEIYREQPEGFVDPEHPDRIWRLSTASSKLQESGIMSSTSFSRVSVSYSPR